MAMAIDNRQQPHLSGMGYDHMRYQAPHFTNPWVSTAAPPSTQLYSAPLTTATSGVESTSQPQVSRPAQVSIPSYSGLQVSAPSLGADALNTSRSYTGAYQSSASPSASSFAPTSAPHYAVEYSHPNSTPFAFQDSTRRSSHPLSTQAQRDSFSDAVDASRGMLSLSQSDITPRNIYGNQGTSRGSSDSYGFPSTHSTHSSISSASTYPSYYNGSVSESVTDYSSASESVGDMGSRTLPRPSALVGTNLPPAPQSMMGQFSSKVSSSSQKKHKCKICDKRFTRPSSLQTHMYSHTGEKPFACEVEGCGRHFSVVSNLRRHRKVHKGERDHPSPEDI